MPVIRKLGDELLYWVAVLTGAPDVDHRVVGSRRAPAIVGDAAGPPPSAITSLPLLDGSGNRGSVSGKALTALG